MKKTKVSYVWDHAGTQLIFTEIGGKITDMYGKEMDFGAGRTLAANYGMVATREGLHGRMLELVQEVMGDNRGEDAWI